MKLRYYQQEAIDATRDFLRTKPDQNPIIVLPTGAGKTPVIAEMCKAAIAKGSRVLILSHRKELLTQNKKHAINHDELEGKVGVYSAGLKQRDTEHPIIIGGIQSVYRRAEELGLFGMVLVDEAHLVSEREESQYQQLFEGLKDVNPDVKLIGLTATPYRTGTGFMCRPENTFNSVSYDICVAELIEKGFLCPLLSKGGLDKATINMDGARVVRGDYTDEDMANKAMSDGMVSAAVEDIITKTADRNKVLVFSVNVEHGRELTNAIRKRTDSCAALEVYGDSIDRDETLARFTTDPKARYLVNCNILTTGFDYPAIDGVALVRPTVSPGLYYQMVGRGLRLHDSKDDCLVLDYGDNIRRHGPINAINPGLTGYRLDTTQADTRKCTNCDEIVMRTRTVCPVCGEPFPVEKVKPSHDVVASDSDIIGKKETKRVKVNRVSYSAHQKQGSVIKTLRADYYYGIVGKVSEWVCFEHGGWARKKAEQWWREHHEEAPPPRSVYAALSGIEMIQGWPNEGGWKKPVEIELETGGQYDKIKKRIYKQEAIA